MVRALIGDPALLPAGRRIAIVGGDLVAVELAEFLAGQDRLVSILFDGELLAPEVGWKRRTEHMDRLDRLGVTVHVGAEVEAVDADGIRFRPANGAPRHLPADAVLLVGVTEPDPTLADALAAGLSGVPIHPVGDCGGSGLIRGATESGARAGAAV